MQPLLPESDEMYGISSLFAEAMGHTRSQASFTLVLSQTVWFGLMHHMVSGSCTCCCWRPSPAAAGDYICEYIGHVVRPVVADRLEAHTYNQLVGAGAA